MYVVSVYRNEADADPSRRHDDDPFDGHEILGIFHSRDEKEMNKQLDVYHQQHPLWQFSIEEV